MEDQADGIDEALESTLRLGLTVAGHLAERATRQREQTHRDAQAASEHDARQLQGRLHSERAAARAALAPVGLLEWWESASPAEIVEAWQTAETFKDVDSDARHVGLRIGDELRTRYAIDVNALGADPAAVRAALDTHDSDKAGAARHRGDAALDEAEAGRLLHDAVQEHQRSPDAAAADVAASGVLYDSAERRRGLAVDLEGLGLDAETVAAVVLADTHQAHPASGAVTPAPVVGGRSLGQGLRAVQRNPRRSDRGR